MDIRKAYDIDAPVQAVWAALTDPQVIERWGGGPVVMSPEPGFAFTFWGGDIHGRVIEAEPGRSMLQEWYGGDWDAPSTVRFTLSPDASGGTLLEVEHTGVPDNEGPDFDAGWDDYYVGPLKALLEEESA
jgi:uncharacterized protein YndB with AHSA1/START domain